MRLRVRGGETRGPHPQVGFARGGVDSRYGVSDGVIVVPGAVDTLGIAAAIGSEVFLVNAIP